MEGEPAEAKPRDVLTRHPRLALIYFFGLGALAFFTLVVMLGLSRHWESMLIALGVGVAFRYVRLRRTMT